MRTSRLMIYAVACVAVLALAGCVERRLTIQTKPQGAMVLLNDEEIGRSPVTVPFNWYGDYRVRRLRGYVNYKVITFAGCP